MDWLDKSYGPLRGRAWGMVLNMFFNAITLYGLARVLNGDGGMPFLIVGGILSLATILTVAIPSK